MSGMPLTTLVEQASMPAQDRSCPSGPARASGSLAAICDQHLRRMRRQPFDEIRFEWSALLRAEDADCRLFGIGMERPCPIASQAAIRGRIHQTGSPSRPGDRNRMPWRPGNKRSGAYDVPADERRAADHDRLRREIRSGDWTGLAGNRKV